MGGGFLKDLYTTYVTKVLSAVCISGFTVSPPALMFLHPGLPELFFSQYCVFPVFRFAYSRESKKEVYIKKTLMNFSEVSLVFFDEGGL